MTDICVMTIDREILRQSISYGHRPSRGSDHDGLDELRGGDPGMFVAPLTIPPPLYRERRWGYIERGRELTRIPRLKHRDTEIQRFKIFSLKH